MISYYPFSESLYLWVELTLSACIFFDAERWVLWDLLPVLHIPWDVVMWCWAIQETVLICEWYQQITNEFLSVQFIYSVLLK